MGECGNTSANKQIYFISLPPAKYQSFISEKSKKLFKKNGTGLSIFVRMSLHTTYYKRKACPMYYILSFESEIEKLTGNTVTVEIPESFVDSQLIGRLIRFRHYNLEYRHKTYTIICPEYMGFDDETILLLPDYFIPGRKYPISVYLYAINIYCTSPCISQREAARLTRDKFGLSKFSHTTLGRALISLELSLSEAPVKQEETKVRRFPTVDDTASRRKFVARFLNNFDKHIMTEAATSINRKLVMHWYGKRRLLII